MKTIIEFNRLLKQEHPELCHYVMKKFTTEPISTHPADRMIKHLSLFLFDEFDYYKVYSMMGF